MGSSIFEPNVKMIIYFLLIQTFPFIQKIYQMPFVSKRVESFFVQLMEDAIKLREEQKIDRDDYLNYLLQLKQKKNLPNIDMVAHTITFFLDGFETSSIVIAHVILFALILRLYWISIYACRCCIIWEQINRFRTD